MKRTTIDQIVYTAAVAALFIAAAPLRAMESDAAIEASLKQTYVYRTYLKDDTINVATKDGVVTWTGTVADKNNRVLAQDTAECLPGVISVDNQLETSAEVDADNADAWLSRKVKLDDASITALVKSALLANRSTSAVNTAVETRNGKVMLTGIAENEAEKSLVTKLANDIQGVTGIQNQMTVKNIVKK